MFNNTRNSIKNISGILQSGTSRVSDSIKKKSEDVDRNTLLMLTRIFTVLAIIMCIFYLVNFCFKVGMFK